MRVGQRSRRGLLGSLGVGFVLLLAGPLLAAPDADPEWRGKLGSDLAGRIESMGDAERVRISVVLSERDMPTRRSKTARRARIRERQQRVLDRPSLGRGFGLRRRYENLPGFAGRATAAEIEALARDSDVEYVYIDRPAFATMAQGRVQVGADQAHVLGFTGTGINVAVLDSGIDTDHPDLSDDLVAERCWCEGSASPLVGCCPAGGDTQSGAGSAEDDDGHGTAVSGIITSSGSVSSLGVAPDAGIVALKVLDANGTGNFADIAAALDWLLTNYVALGVSVVNISIGDGGEHSNPASTPCSGFLTANAIEDLVAAGLTVFVASGNDAFTDGISYPACVADAISVGGVYDASFSMVSWCGATCDDILCTDAPVVADDFVCHTNSDEILDLLAPDFRTFTSEVGGTAANFGGTSAASPYAAALAALLIERDPALTPAGLRTLMTSNGPLVNNSANGLNHRRTDVSTFFGICGDGNVDIDEDCDDNNTNDGDCCSSACLFEAFGSVCDDADACTAPDTCDGGGTCSGAPIVCDDGLFCNGGETCDAGAGCQPGVPPTLDDGIACTLDGCDEVGDVVTHTPDDSACADGAFCNGAEICDVVSGCLPGAPVVVDDGVGCTTDACDEVGDTVTHTPVDAICDDAAYCNGVETCDPILDCVSGSAPNSDDGVSCTVDSCDEIGDVIVNTPDAGLCDDSDPCTAESCHPVTGCAYEPILHCPLPVPVGGPPFAALVALMLGVAGFGTLLRDQLSLRARPR